MHDTPTFPVEHRPGSVLHIVVLYVPEVAGAPGITGGPANCSLLPMQVYSNFKAHHISLGRHWVGKAGGSGKCNAVAECWQHIAGGVDGQHVHTRARGDQRML